MNERRRKQRFKYVALGAILISAVIACGSQTTPGAVEDGGATAGDAESKIDAPASSARDGGASDGGNGSGDSGPGSDSGSCVTNSDLNLDTGIPFSASCTIAPCFSAGSIIKTSGGTALWNVDVDAFNSSSGTGTMSIGYTGTGAVNWTIDYSGLNSSPINGYPMIQVGSGDGE